MVVPVAAKHCIGPSTSKVLTNAAKTLGLACVHAAAASCSVFWCALICPHDTWLRLFVSSCDTGATMAVLAGRNSVLTGVCAFCLSCSFK